MLDEVSLLFADHPDLLKEFTYFLPDAVQAQAKAQLDQVAKESEARKRAEASKQAIMQQAQGMQQQTKAMAAPSQRRQNNQFAQPAPAPIPFGATQGRSDDREREIARAVVYGTISFAPVRPPRKDEPTATQTASKKGRPQMVPELPVQPTTAESAFFERAKLHLSRKELAPDKPPGSRRHTPHAEFLKCLHLFGAGILNKEELLLLLRGLFMQGHAPKTGINAGGGASNPAVANDAQELLREFEEVLVSRGHFYDQEVTLKTKSKYGDKQVREMDFSGCERLAPSYRTYPSDYPLNKFLFYSGQSGMDASVLNNDVVCVPDKRNRIWSPEDYDGPSKRHNPYEEAMFLAEDERFEVDMAIERNVMAMRQVEPIAEEVTQLRENEEKDGQPIGRMNYKLRSRQLNNAQINAIARLYGDSGDEVLQHLVRNPVAVLPIVNHRLRQKDVEWRKAKHELVKRWNTAYKANFEGCLDVTCWFYKRDLEKCFDEKKLVKQAKNAKLFVKEPSVLASRVATKEYYPQFLMGNTDSDTLIYQPYMKIPVSAEMPHKDAYQLIMTAISMCKSETDQERASRIWAEFMLPFFSFPVHWLDDGQDASNDKKSSVVVKYAVGQRVVTAFGEGEIVATVEATASSAFRYKVNLPSGTGFIRPESIHHSAFGSGYYVRSGGRMRSSDIEFDGSEHKMDSKYKLVFVEERVYKFLRMYCLLISILQDSKSRLASEEKTDMETEEKAGDNGEKSKEETKESEQKYDYSSYLATLKEVVKSRTNNIDFETFCRTTCKEKVAQLKVLPKLIEACSSLLLNISKDNTLLSAFDYSLWGENDPVKLRSQCLSVSDDSCYRAQIDANNIYFSYVEPDQDLMALPEEEDDDGMDDAEDGEIEESGEDLHVEENGQPDAKRQKMK